MRLNPTQLSAQLARGLAACYGVAGEEPLLITESLDAIRAAARKAGYSERETHEADKQFEWQRLVESCATGSLFAERRIVEVRLEGAPGEEGGGVLAELASNSPPDVLLILVTGRLDARARNAKWWTAFENQGAAVYAWPVRPDEFPQWLSARLRAAGFQPTSEALALLATRTEGNLLAAAQEITKLALLQKPGTLDGEAVAAAVADSAHTEVFTWLDRVLAGDGTGAVRGLQLLREEGEDLLPMLGALAFDLRKLFVAAQGVARGQSTAAAAEASGVFKQRQSVFARAAGRVRPPQVLSWLRQCNIIDGLVKTGGQSAAWEDLLTLTLAVSGTAKGGFTATRK
jgi:DNA polymerase-3 subunit delta